MARAKELTSEKRAQIQILRQHGMKVKDIATSVGVTHSCVVKTLQRISETDGYLSRRRSGRPRCTSTRDDRLIRRFVVANPFSTASEVSAEIFPNQSPSLCTIRRRLSNEMGLKSYKAARKPKLTPKNIKDRISFCKKFKDWGLDQWSRVMFTDETLMQQFRSSGHSVRRPPNQRFNVSYVIPTVKSSHKLMIWGGICSKGRCGLWFMPNNITINGNVYLSILQEKVPAFINIHSLSVFQHDGAPCHQTKAVSAWLRQQRIEILGPWPGNSPDLNPIENCWKILKDKVAKLHPTSSDDLRQKVMEVWTQEINPEFCLKLVSSMPTRIKAVLKAKGMLTKY